MSTNHTANYNLSQWSPSDSFLRAEFNENLQKIDAALTAKTELSVGVFTGDGANVQAIPLGFRPKAVLVEQLGGRRDLNAMCGVLAVDADGGVTSGYGSAALTITDAGFTVKLDRFFNSSGTQFLYIAFH